MKLEGAQRVAQSFEETLGTPRKVGVILAGAVLMTGLAVVGALFIGGSLVDAREAFADLADHEAAHLGFGASDIDIRGVSGARADEVRAAILPQGRASLFSADPREVRGRVEQLGWVEKASVRRVWPSTLKISVTRRAAFALWKQGPNTAVIDAAGRALSNVRATELKDLPIVIGPGAGPAAQNILAAVENSPTLRGRVVSAARIGDRRWDITLKSGAVLTLPSDEPDRALRTIDRLQASYHLLDRPLARIDLRENGRVSVAPQTELVGGPGLAGA
jgi:cell division protein FtsQ